MGIAERKHRQKQALRESILSAALELAREKGWNAVSTRKVADRVEYSTTVIYEHFGNKDAMLHALQEEGFRDLATRIRAVKQRWPDQPAEQLVAYSLEKWRFANENPELYRVMFSLGGVQCGCEPCHQMVGLWNEVKSTLKQIAPKAPIDELKMSWLAQVHGFISIHLNSQFPTQLSNIEAFIEASIRRFANSLAK